jgi:hypothetical protein
MKPTPKILIIECPEPHQNIVLALESLEENNKTLKESISDSNKQLEWIRKLLGGL